MTRSSRAASLRETRPGGDFTWDPRPAAPVLACIGGSGGLYLVNLVTGGVTPATGIARVTVHWQCPLGTKRTRKAIRNVQSRVDVQCKEIPGYGHLDTFIGRGAALDVFGYITDFLDRC